MQRKEQVEEGKKERHWEEMEKGKEDEVWLYHEFMIPLPLVPKPCITDEFHVPVEIVYLQPSLEHVAIFKLKPSLPKHSQEWATQDAGS